MVDRDSSGTAWTAERVCETAIAAFRLLPTMPVYAPRLGGLAAVLSGQDIGPLEILGLSEAVLGRDAPERKALFLWARAKATGGDVGGSVAAYCRAAGVSENTFRRRRKAACQRIATALQVGLLGDGDRMSGVSGGARAPWVPVLEPAV